MKKENLKLNFEKYQQQVKEKFIRTPISVLDAISVLNNNIEYITNKFRNAAKEGILKPDYSSKVKSTDDKLMSFYEGLEYDMGVTLSLIAVLHNILKKRMDTSARLSLSNSFIEKYLKEQKNYSFQEMATILVSKYNIDEANFVSRVALLNASKANKNMSDSQFLILANSVSMLASKLEDANQIISYMKSY